MKLWTLDLNEEFHGYDRCYGFVIRAETEEKAREIAHENGGDENRDNCYPWLNPKSSTCEELTVIGKEGIILKYFNAG